MKLKSNEIPILFICYNRPSKLKLVLEQFHDLKPNSLYFHFDGPRSESDVDLIKRSADLLQGISWKSKIETYFNESNLGCGRGVHNAVSWFFENEKFGLIMEDDVLIDTSFLEILSLYFAHEISFNLAGISGFNRVPKEHLSEPGASFYKSIYAQSIAWGTRRELWEGFTLDYSNWGQGLKNPVFAELGNRAFQEFWKKLVNEEILSGKLDTWDVQWQLYNWKMGRKFAITSSNFATHIGFGSDATHTKSDTIPNWHPLEMEKFQDNYNLIFPLLANDIDADSWSNNNFYPITTKAKIHLRLSQLKAKIREFLLRWPRQ